MVQLFFKRILLILPLLFLQACIGDDIINDFVEPELRITNPLDTLGIGDSFQFQTMYLNAIGLEETADPVWSSSDPSVISISAEGLATANALGSAVISAEVMPDSVLVQDEFILNVGETTVQNASIIEGFIQTTSSYVLTGDFTLEENGNELLLSFENNYEASSALPGLYLYLSNNSNSVNGAFEVGPVSVFSGAHTYNIPDAGLFDYSYLVYFCKPFNVKVGDGAL